MGGTLQPRAVIVKAYPAAQLAAFRPRHRQLPSLDRIRPTRHDAAQSLGALLSLPGAELRTVYSGPDALAALPAFRPEVVLLDIGMPVMDGHEVARRIHQQPGSAT